MARQKKEKESHKEIVTISAVVNEPIMDYVPQREIEKEEKIEIYKDFKNE